MNIFDMRTLILSLSSCHFYNDDFRKQSIYITSQGIYMARLKTKYITSQGIYRAHLKTS